MPAKKPKATEPSGPPIPDPTKCDNCGKPLGNWFSLGDKAYCSPCFNSKFWAPFQSASKAT